MSRTKLLIYFGHPAQFLFLRPVLQRFKTDGNVDFRILIKSKDVLEDLIKAAGFNYVNILPAVRSKSKLAIVKSIVLRTLAVFRHAKDFKPTLLWGGDPSVSFVGKLTGIPSVIVSEDDYGAIIRLARITYPFATTILCPQVCDVGPYQKKKTGYNGYMKLSYLHPSVFSVKEEIAQKYTGEGPYVLIRLSNLSAYHDEGIAGFSESTLDQLIKEIEPLHFQIFISAEGKINKKYAQYLLHTEPADLIHVLGRASLFIGDSQSMTVEACMLGVPSVRYSGFVGKISVLEELEHSYGLTVGVVPDQPARLLTTVRELLSQPDLSEQYKIKRAKMLAEKINVSQFLYDFIKGYAHKPSKN